MTKLVGLMVLCAGISSAIASPAGQARAPGAILVSRGEAFDHRPRIERRAVEVCAMVSEHEAAVASCPPGMAIVHVSFASYGTPEGSCARFAVGACHANGSASVAAARCVGQASCAVPAENDAFGDPCVGTVKRLALQVTCSR